MNQYFRSVGLFLSLTTAFCSSAFAAQFPSTRVGVSGVETHEDGKMQFGVRAYFNPIASEPGAYYVALIQYRQFFKIAPQYLGVQISQRLSDGKLGYLKHILDKMSVYKMTPGSDELTYQWSALTVDHGQVVVDTTVSPRVLKLSARAAANDPLGGATLSAGAYDAGTVTFPIDSNPGGIEKNLKLPKQYLEVRNGYALPIPPKKLPLKSTWKKEYIANPFLAAYNKRGDVVVNFLQNESGAQLAHFKINREAPESPENRVNIFTNPRSATLEGLFHMDESPAAGSGLFAQTALKGTNQAAATEVEGRIGVFIDIVDATEALGQFVVEVGFLNPKDPTDFLMYYEDPDKAEVRGKKILEAQGIAPSKPGRIKRVIQTIKNRD